MVTRRTIKVLLVAVAALVVVGIASGSTSVRHTNRLCLWIEQSGSSATFHDVKTTRGHRNDTRVCIVGRRGKAGAKAAAGSPGVRGPAGPVGAQGPKGAQGFMGLQGLIGLDGPMGLSGENGSNGVDGQNGIAGIDGQNGAPGQPGAAGATGLSGIDGVNGQDGATGPSGVDGVDGKDGAIGPAGPAGEAGSAGPAGPIGPQGPAGANGIDGSTIVTVGIDATPGQKTTTAMCPLTSDPNDDPTARTFAISGGFSAQGSVTESYRNEAVTSGHGWTVTQSSGNTDSLRVFVYCIG